MRWTSTQLALPMLAVAILGGCGTVPIVSGEQQVNQASLEEQQDWVETQVDEALAVLGPPEGWWEADRSFQWPRDRKMLIDAAATETCRPSHGGYQPGQLVFELHHDSFGDPAAAAARLRVHWAAEGWVVSNITDPQYSTDLQDSTDRRFGFRADREDGSMLAFDGNEIFVRLGVFSSCSENVTVTMR
jgi:hypothetical protein